MLEGERNVKYTTLGFDVVNQYGSTALSANGKYLTFRDGLSGAIQQRNLVTGTTTTIAASSAAKAPQSSADGSVVVYQVGNDLFKWDRRSNTTTQVTNAQGAETYAGLSLSADGASLAFTATTNYQNGSSVASASGTGSQKIAHINLSSGIVSTLSTAVAGTFPAFQLSANGTRLVFASTADLVGSNADANREVYLADFSGASPVYSQVTQTTGTNITNALISDNGQIFIGTTQNLGGVNAGGFSNLIRYDIASGTFDRLTNNTSAGVNIRPRALTASGSSITFLANANLTGENPNSFNQIFTLDLVQGQLRQRTTYNDSASQINDTPVISADGSTALLMLWDGMLLPTSYDLVDLSGGSSSLVTEVGGGTQGTIRIAYGDLIKSLRGLGGVAISSQSGALEAIEYLQENLSSLAAIRGNLGAGLSRLEAASNLLSTQALEIQAAHGRIVNADVAGEVAHMTRARILQDISSALLGTANLQPEIALRLLDL